MSGRIVVFGREPRAGRVKTRLAEAIGGAAAAAVYAFLLEHALAVARATCYELRLSLADAPSRGWVPPFGIEHDLQSSGDLGERMAHAFRLAFDDGADRVLLIGSDIAHLRRGHLERAFAALAERPVVLGPAADGGYWLVGQRRPGTDLFSGVPWSSPDTAAVTRRRLAAQGVRWTEIATLHDVDAVDDLRRALDDPRVDAALRRRLRAAVDPV